MILFGKPPHPLTRSAFETWPPHMRTEFVLLAAERGMGRKAVQDGTGITPAMQREAAGQRHAFQLPQVAGYHVEDGAPLDPAGPRMSYRYD